MKPMVQVKLITTNFRNICSLDIGSLINNAFNRRHVFPYQILYRFIDSYIKLQIYIYIKNIKHTKNNDYLMINDGYRGNIVFCYSSSSRHGTKGCWKAWPKLFLNVGLLVRFWEVAQDKNFCSPNYFSISHNRMPKMRPFVKIFVMR